MVSLPPDHAILQAESQIALNIMCWSIGLAGILGV